MKGRIRELRDKGNALLKIILNKVSFEIIPDMYLSFIYLMENVFKAMEYKVLSFSLNMHQLTIQNTSILKTFADI